MSLKYLGIFFLSLSAFVNVSAGVSLKNGNFYISFVDVATRGGEGHRLLITRTYNSQAIKKGWFGYGWGSDYETFLSPSADGSITVHENGTGARTRFTSSAKKSQVGVEEAVKKIVSVILKKSSLSSREIKSLKENLRNDAMSRQSYAKRYNVTATLPVGQILYSHTRGKQKLEILKDGFKRTLGDNKIEIYNKEGNLREIKDKYNYTIKFIYKNKLLSSIKDTQSNQIFFEWFSSGQVKNIWVDKNKKATYLFENANLVKSIDSDKNLFRYDYDHSHNMKAIHYKDGTSLKIAYNKKQFVSRVTERNKRFTNYKYGDKSNKHFWTLVSRGGRGRKKEFENRYEYELKTKPDGTTYTHRILTNIFGLKTETIFTECCSLPLKIQRGKTITNFEYDKEKLIQKTSNRGDFVKMTYHKKFNKITKIVTNKDWTTFDYNKQGNLFKALNSKGKSVLLIYSRKQIKKIIAQDASKKRQVLTFKYNPLNKPKEIAIPGLGTINIIYNDEGKVQEVKSSSSKKIATQVREVFQSLVAIVKPAGIVFTF